MPAPSCFTCWYSTACDYAEQYPQYTNPLLCNKPVTLPEKVWPHVWPIVEASYWCTNFREKPIYPGYEWILPTSHYEEPPEQWTDPAHAYDSNFISVSTYPKISSGEYSTFLELLIEPAIICDKVRFCATSTRTTIKADIDVYYNDAWHDVSSAAFVSKALTEVDIESGPWTISKARFRLYLPSGLPAEANGLYEFHLDKVNMP